MATNSQLGKVQSASRLIGDTTGAAVSRPSPMMVPLTSTSTMFPLNPMPTPHSNPMPTPAAAQMVSTVPEPMKLDTVAKRQEELHAYIGERRNDRSNQHDNSEPRRCHNCASKGTWPATVRRINHHLQEERVEGEDQARLEEM